MRFLKLPYITVIFCLSALSLQGLPFGLRWNPSRSGANTYITLDGKVLPIAIGQYINHPTNYIKYPIKEDIKGSIIHTRQYAKYPNKIEYMVTDMRNILHRAKDVADHMKIKQRTHTWTQQNIHATDLDANAKEMLEFGVGIYCDQYKINYQALGAIIIETTLQTWAAHHGNSAQAMQGAIDIYQQVLGDARKKFAALKDGNLHTALLAIPLDAFCQFVPTNKHNHTTSKTFQP